MDHASVFRCMLMQLHKWEKYFSEGKFEEALLFKLKHTAILTIIKLMIHKNILLSLCLLLATAVTVSFVLCSVIALLCCFNVFMTYHL